MNVDSELTCVYFITSETDIVYTEQEWLRAEKVSHIVGAYMGLEPVVPISGISYLSIDQLADYLGIDPISASRTSAGLANQIVGPLINNLNLFCNVEDVGLREALLNHTSLLYHKIAYFELVFKSIEMSGVKNFVIDQRCGNVIITDRPDVKKFSVSPYMWGSLITEICSLYGCSLAAFRVSTHTALVVNKVRIVAIQIYKMYNILKRSGSFRGTKSNRIQYSTGIFVRAKSELIASLPVYELRKKLGFNDVFLVDDLLKNPDCSDAITTRKMAAIYIPSQMVWYKVLRLLCSYFARIVLTKSLKKSLSLNITGPKLCSSRPVVCAINWSLLLSLPELLVYRAQVNDLLKLHSFQQFLSFDTVSRWGGLQGAIAKIHQIPSSMIQNTAVEDICYPLPLSCERLFVANQRIKNIFIRSGAPINKVLDYGLPLNDTLIHRGDVRTAKRNTKKDFLSPKVHIVIATQPFVQTESLNQALISDVVDALNGYEDRVELTIKVHPRENSVDYWYYLKKLEAHNFSSLRIDVDEINNTLGSTDVLVSRTSTVLQQAILHAVPCISYLKDYPSEIISRIDYLSAEACVKVTDISELRVALVQYLKVSTSSAVTRRFFTHRKNYIMEEFNGPNATSKIVKALEI
jgi:hypothetical protein